MTSLGTTSSLTLAATTLPAWAEMWLLVVALFGGFKVLMFFRAVAGGMRPTFGRAVGFFFAWPGLDARAFLSAGKTVAKPTPGEWRDSVAHVVLGAALFWGLTRFVLPVSWLAGGWIAMAGIVFVLHFGLFRLMTLAWRQAGVDAPLMMISPMRATSVTEFWGKRWNRDFRIVAHDLIFRPLHRKLGAFVAVFIVFVFSGFAHELVISVPARGGYGLPMGYFLLQFAGLGVEASRFGKNWRLGRGFRGWLFTFVVTGIPSIVLFHPVFIERVILPFVEAMGGS